MQKNEYRLCMALALPERNCSKEANVSYINADKILPEELIRWIQEYVDGVYIYIPRKPGMRHPWGQGTNYKNELSLRNACIRKDYADGISITSLIQKYHLSEKSIRRILQNR